MRYHFARITSDVLVLGMACLLAAVHSRAETLVSAGWSQITVVKDGGLWGCGHTSLDTRIQNVPIIGGLVDPWVAIEDGDEYTLALDGEGRLWGWGATPPGVPGDGSGSSQRLPVRRGGNANWKSISAYGEVALGVMVDGTLWELTPDLYENGEIVQSAEPVRIGSSNDWKSVVAGNGYYFAIGEDASLWAWGYNSHGNLGDGTTITQDEPVRVGTANDWLMVDTARWTSMGVKTDGSLWVWGVNGGLYGDGSTAISATRLPQQIGTETDWRSVSLGDEFVIALKWDGSLWSWGANSTGQLGLGDFTKRTVPVRIGSANSWTSVEAGEEHVIASQADGSIWVWGGNNSSSLGDPLLNFVSSPLEITQLFEKVPEIKVTFDIYQEASSGVTRWDLKTGIVGEPAGGVIKIENKGLALLVISAIHLSEGFSAVALPAEVPPLAAIDVEIRRDTQRAGRFSGECHLLTNDPEIPDFSIELQADVVSPRADTDGDGMNDAAEVAMAVLGFNWQIGDPARVSSFYQKSALLGLRDLRDLPEFELRPGPPVPGAVAGSWEMGLEIHDGGNGVPVTLVPGDLRLLDAKTLELSVPVDPGADFVRLKGVGPAPAP